MDKSKLTSEVSRGEKAKLLLEEKIQELYNKVFI